MFTMFLTRMILLGATFLIVSAMELGSNEEGASAVDVTVAAAVGLAALAGLTRRQKKAAKKKMNRAVVSDLKTKEKLKTEMDKKAEKDAKDASALADKKAMKAMQCAHAANKRELKATAVNSNFCVEAMMLIIIAVFCPGCCFRRRTSCRRGSKKNGPNTLCVHASNNSKNLTYPGRRQSGQLAEV